MISEFTILGITFHLYGLILGVAIITGLQITFSRLRKSFSTDESMFYSSAGIVLVVGIIGARLWHLATDYFLYVNDWWAVFSIWNGGLSILGGLLFGGLAIFFLQKRIVPRIPVAALLDSVALAFPFAQAIGRWGNFINQELYGLPTSLAWGIFIDIPHRLPGYESIERYHPLFFYEGFGMLLLGIFLWKKQTSWKLGSGKFFVSMLGVYAIFRFFLDFLRIDTPKYIGSLGVNQVLLLGFICVGVFFYYRWSRDDAKDLD